MLEICKADAILQFGFDETAIDLQSTMNMWALIKQKDKLRVVAVQVGAILPCGTASGCADHLEEAFKMGQDAVLEVRKKLAEMHGGEVANDLVPLVRGGVLFHKIGAIRREVEARATAYGIVFFGEDGWAALFVGRQGRGESGQAVCR